MNRLLIQKEVIELTGFSPDKVRRLAELNLIKFNGKYYQQDSILQYLDYEKRIIDSSFNINDFTKFAQIPKYTGIHNLQLHFPEEFNLLEIIKLAFPINGKYIFITKDSSLTFRNALDKKRVIFSTHISTKEANKRYGFGFARIKYYTKIKKLNPIIAPPNLSERGLYYPIAELEGIIAEEQAFLEKHYPVSAVKKMLGYAESSLCSIMTLVKEGFLTFRKTEYGIINENSGHNTFWITKESVHSFLDLLENSYLKLDYIENKLKLSHIHLLSIFSHNDKLIINKQIYIKKEKALKLLERYDLKSIEEAYSSKPNVPSTIHNYYTLKGIVPLCSRTEKTLYKLLQKPKYKNLFKDYVEPINQGDFWKINKKEVDDYLEEIIELKKRYYTRAELLKKLHVQTDFQHIPITSIKVPLYMKFFTNILSSYLYDKQEAQRFFDNPELSHLIFEQSQLSLSDYIKSFIDLREFPEILKETAALLKSFAEQNLSAKQASPDTLNSYKREYLIAIEYLLKYPLKKEIYLLDNTEVQLFIEKCSSTHHKTCLWRILTFIEKERLCRYSLKKLPNPRKQRIKKEQEKISFDDWLEIYKYAQKLDIHLHQAIIDKQYANLWLFVMILLTNAWRPSDAFRIPPIQPEIIGIPNINLLKHHKITKPKAQKIINIIRSYNLVTAKNGMPRDFTCNLDLLEPMVTALCICEFHRRESNIPTIIDFTTERKKKNTITGSDFNHFFERNMKLQHIKFSPLIANRSLMEHLFYSIQEKKGKGNSAFELVMKLRKHKTEVTKEYISDGGNKISLHLFSRGEFGFLYDHLIELLTDKHESTLSQRTLDICQLKRFFEPFEIENFSYFLSKVMNDEEQNLMDKLLSLTPNQAFEYMRKMYLGHMPSKKIDAQCLIYPNCHRPSNMFSCNQCPFAVHNVYALTSIFNEFDDSIQRYKNTNKNGVKQREQNTIFKLQNLLIKAIEKFGEDYVFSFYTGGENAFVQQLVLIEE
ncbi:hypothetical protein ACIQYX_18130 [Bacillus toyonensis]|uniref:hypothetical protein n=1 Tax=Bacillus toyonensis TaxID=155322 RepID=UPI00382F55C1